MDGNDHRSPAAALTAIADRVRPMLAADRLPILDEAMGRARSGRARILVIGEAKRGKSTLVNTLFGADLLPTGVLPVTSVATVVTVGATLSAEARFRDGRLHRIGMDEVAGLVSQRGNPDNCKGVDRVLLTAPCPHLPEGTDVVDTPGTGSIHVANTTEATCARSTVDLAVLVVAADPPVSAAEVALVAEVMSTASAGAIVLNKTDLVEPADVAEIVTFTRQAVRQVLNTDLPVFAMSLRGTGIEALIEWLAVRLAEHGEGDVVAATARALCREVVAVADSLRVEQHLLAQTGRNGAATVAALRDILRRAEASRTGAADHVRGEARRARQLLDGQHEREVARALAAARFELGTQLPAGPGSPEQESDRARARVNTVTADACQEWFSRAGKELDAALRVAADRVLTTLRAELAEARQTAEQTLRVRLSEVDEPPAAPLPRPPWLDLGDEVVWRELISTTIARHLPAPVRRRRLHHHLVEWTEHAVPRPFGRCRSRLQDWLEVATRDIEHGLAATWQAQLAGLEHGIEEATRHCERTGAEITGRREQLAECLATLDAALVDLDRLAPHAGTTFTA